MTIVDTLADEHYRDRQRLAFEFARVINEEARDLVAAGLDVLQLDEPAFNVYMDDVAAWGIAALHRAIEGLACTTAVHICYGYGIKANIDWKRRSGASGGSTSRRFRCSPHSRIDQVSLECANSKVPLSLLGLLAGKDVLVGCIDVASATIETPAEVAATIRRALEHVPPERLYPCTNCGMVPLSARRRARQAAGTRRRRALGQGGARRLMYDADPRQGSLGEVDAGWFGTDEGTLPIGAPFRPGLDPLPARSTRGRW